MVTKLYPKKQTQVALYMELWNNLIKYLLSFSE